MNRDKPIPNVHIRTEKLPSGEYTAKAQLQNDIITHKAWEEREAIRGVQAQVVEKTLGKRG